MTVRLLFNRIQSPLYFPEEAVDTGKDLTVDDALEFLNRETDDKELIDLDDKKDDKDKDKEIKDKETDTEDEDLKKLEEDLEDEEIDEDKLELATPVRRSEILKEFPDIFKKFPYLEKAYYREQQFTEVFSTIDDAKEALSKAETFDKLEADLFTGNTELMLKAVKENDPNAFNKIIDNYLPALAAVDQTAYHHIIGNITKHTIQSMLDEAGGMEEESGRSLKIAAQILNQFVFGSNKFTAPTKLSTDKPKDDNKDKLDTERQQFAQQKFDDAVDTLNTRVNNSIKSTIEEYIDPKKSMTDFVRKHAINDAVKEISDLLNNDTRFKTLVDKLWDKAAKNNYSKSLLDDIRNAHMSRAKTVLLSVIKTARNNALKGMGKRVSEDNDDKKGPITRRSTTSSNNDSGKDKNNGPKKGESNLDFMMRNS